MNAYSQFKTELAALCERGKVSKNLKNKLSHYDEVSPSERVGLVCSDFYDFVSESGPKSEEVASAGSAVAAFVDGEKQGAADCIKNHYDTVVAYIKLVAKANAVATKDAAQKLSEFYESFCKSLECIKFGLPLF